MGQHKAQRARPLVYLIGTLFLLGAIAIVIFRFPFGEASKRWWQEVKSFLSPSRLNRKMRALRLLQEAQEAVRREDWRAAEKMAKAALKIAPEEKDAWFLLASLLARKGHWEEIEELAERAGEGQVRVGILLIAADACYFRRDWKRAEKFYRKVLTIEPANATALNNFGYMLAERGIRLAEAEEMIRKALEKEPNNAAFIDSLGWVYYQRGQFEEARKWIERAVRLAPNDSELRYHLGMVYYRLGQWGKARKELWKALQLNPRHQKALRALERLHRERQERKRRGETMQI